MTWKPTGRSRSRGASTAQPDGARPAPERGSRRTAEKRANAVVAGLAVASAGGGAFAGCHPTGNSVLDVLYPALFAGLVTLSASRASRSVLLVATTVAFAMSRGWLWLPSGAAMVVSFVATFHRRSHRRLAALIGALLSQVILRWAPVGFHGATALVAGAVAAVVMVSGWRRSRARARKRTLVIGGGVLGLGVLFTLVAAVSVLLARGSAETGITSARQSLSQIESGQSAAGGRTVRTSASDLKRASELTNGWWNAGAYLVPVVAQQQRALARSTRAGAELTATAASVSSELDYSALRYSSGRIDLSALAAIGAPAEALHASAAHAEASVSSTQSPWLLASIQSRIQSLGSEVTRVTNDSQTAVLAARSAPAILGADGVRHYLVAFMTPAETRGLGGFVGAYGVLTVDDGRISLSSSGATSDLKQTPGSAKVTGLASYLARYGSFDPLDHFQDLTYAPDMPTVEDVMAQVFPQVGGQPVDGVMVLDPYALAAMLNFTGPVTVAGFPTQLTAANAADVLLRQQYLTDTGPDRKDLLQAALHAGFVQLTAGALPAPKTISDVLGPEVRKGRLLFWSSHPSDQPLLDQVGLAGAFPQPGPASDVLAVTLANAANNKIDAYLTQQTNYSVDYDPSNGWVAATLTIKLTNSAPSTGMPAYVIADNAGSGLPPGTNLTWLCLYSPLGLQGATLDGHVTGFSSAVAQLGVDSYCSYVNIPSESSSTLVITLNGHITPGPTYRLAVRLQPLANPQTETVAAAIGSGSPTAWAAGPAQVQWHAWNGHP